MNITINSNIYKIHMVNKTNYHMYETLLTNTNICDVVFVKKSYENLAYTALEYDGYVGFFLSNTNNTVLYVSAIFDLNCSQLQDKLDNISVQNNHAIELTMLCSNARERISGLTSDFLKYLLNYIPKYKPNIHRIYLYIAQGSINTRALSFYTKIGFKEIQPNIMEYRYVHEGGKKRKQSKKYTKSKKHKKNITRYTRTQYTRNR